MHKHLLVYFNRKGIVYKAGCDFSGEGGYQAVYMKIYALALPFRSDLGNKPNQAAVDPNAEQKIRACAELDPFKNSYDLLFVLARGITKYMCLHGWEVSFFFHFFLVDSMCINRNHIFSHFVFCLL